MQMDHLFLEELPKGVKTLYYQGKRFTREEFIQLKDKSMRKGDSKLIT